MWEILEPGEVLIEGNPASLYLQPFGELGLTDRRLIFVAASPWKEKFVLSLPRTEITTAKLGHRLRLTGSGRELVVTVRRSDFAFRFRLASRKDASAAQFVSELSTHPAAAPATVAGLKPDQIRIDESVVKKVATAGELFAWCYPIWKWRSLGTRCSTSRPRGREFLDVGVISNVRVFTTYELVYCNGIAFVPDKLEKSGIAAKLPYHQL